MCSSDLTAGACPRFFPLCAVLAHNLHSFHFLPLLCWVPNAAQCIPPLRVLYSLIGRGTLCARQPITPTTLWGLNSPALQTLFSACPSHQETAGANRPGCPFLLPTFTAQCGNLHCGLPRQKHGKALPHRCPNCQCRQRRALRPAPSHWCGRSRAAP